MKTYDVKKKKVVNVGEIRGDTFTKIAKPKHYMIREGGYGIQQAVLLQLLDDGIKKIRVKTKTKTYENPIQDWVKYGKAKDYGHGTQVFLEVDRMNEWEE